MRKELKRAIRASKKNWFLCLYDNADKDPWDLAYKIVTKTRSTVDAVLLVKQMAKEATSGVRWK